MSAKFLLLTTYWGLLVIALICVVFVLTGVEWMRLLTSRTISR